jgi:hypothetical protein
MSFTSDQLIKLRRKQQASKKYMAIENPATAATMQVNGAHDVGSTTITVDGDSVTYTPEQYFTVYVGTSAGKRDKGVTWVQSYATGTLTLHYNNIGWSDNDYITIKRQVIPQIVLPDVAETTVNDVVVLVAVDEQGTTYTDQNTNRAALINVGCLARPVFIDSNTGLATLKFYLEATQLGGAITSVAWAFDGGTPLTSGASASSASPLIVTWNSTGQKWCKLTVTDEYGKQTIRYITVYVFNRTNTRPYEDFEIQNLSGNYENAGWEYSFTMQGYSAANFPYMAQVVLFYEHWYGSEQAKIATGWIHQEEILYAGWIKNVKTELNPEFSETPIETYSTSSWMKDHIGWPVSMDYEEGSVQPWHTLPSMNADKAMIHILSHHTNLRRLVDVDQTGNTLDLRPVDTSETSILTQINDEIYMPIRAKMCSDRLGRLVARQNQQLVSEGSRTIDIIFDMQNDDWLEKVDIVSEEVSKPTLMVDLRCMYYDITIPKTYQSFAPRRETTTGSVDTSGNGTRADSQADCNTLAGLYLAYKNAEFKEVTFKMAGLWLLDIIPQQTVRVTLQTGDTIRGLEWTNKHFFVKQVQIEHDGGCFFSTLTLEEEVYGIDGVEGIVSGTVPSATTNAPSPDTPPFPSVTTPGSELVYVLTSSKLGRTRNWTS